MPVTESLEQRHRRAINALNRGDLRAMVAECRAIVAADEKFADAWFLLAIAAEAQRDLPRAIALVDRALALSADNAEYLAQKAKLLALLDRSGPARDAARAALAAGPNRGLTCDTLGVVFTRIGDHRRAAQVLHQAIALSPDNPQFHFNLASAEQFLGHADAARRHYERAIALQPRFARAWWALSELEKNAPDPRREAQLQALFADDSLSAIDRLYVGHALSRLWEQRGDYARAFATLGEAKAARRGSLGYSAAADRELFTALRTAFREPDAIPRPRGDDWTPLFVVGMPRSGTTLVEQILAAHPAIGSLGELQAFGQAVKAVSGDRSPALLDAGVVEAALAADSGEIARRYRAAVRARLADAPTAAYLADKMPLNFLYVGFILRALPEARIVLVRRNPLDTCLSNYRQLFAVNFSYYNYAYAIEDTAAYYAQFDALCGHWLALYGKRIHVLEYEALVARPREQVAGALDYLGLPWSDDCLAFHRQDGAVTTASTMQVREPLYSSAVGRWRRYEKELAPAMALLDEQGIDYRRDP